MNNRILRLAVPNIISNITIPLLGMVDMGLMGHLGDERYIGAVAVGSMIFNFIYWGFSFLRMGTSGFVAQDYGRRYFTGVMLTLSRALLVAGAGGVLLILLQKPISMLSFFIIDSSSEVEVLARQYFHIRIFAAPATIGLYALTGWFIGMQNARFPMMITIMVNILNLGFNLLFIKVFGMTSDGVALGTVIAQYSGLATGLFLLHKYYRRIFHYNMPSLVLKKKALLRFFNVNRDIFIRTLCLIFSLSFFTAKSASTGDTILAVNSLLLQYFMFYAYFVDGFAYAAEALSGRYYGAGNRGRLKESIRLLFRWGGGIALVFTITYLSGGRYLIYLLTNNETVISTAMTFFPWIILIPVITFPAFIWDGIYIGTTASVAMRNAMVISTVAVFLPAYYLLEPVLGNHGLWLAFMLFMVSRGVSLTAMAKRAVLNMRPIGLSG